MRKYISVHNKLKKNPKCYSQFHGSWYERGKDVLTGHIIYNQPKLRKMTFQWFLVF